MTRTLTRALWTLARLVTNDKCKFWRSMRVRRPAERRRHRAGIQEARDEQLRDGGARLGLLGKAALERVDGAFDVAVPRREINLLGLCAAKIVKNHAQKDETTTDH